ncbi:chaplin family protein [Streptomyces sp. NBC_00104]|uniref:chaplin n=1 Tax=Streptomyces sp. NBC_00104 TaxID=2903621 RepID=UPI00324D6674
MRQTLRKRMVVVAATTGLLSLYGTPVLADTGAHGAASNSPGVASGNTVEVPVTVPVNVCGNTVDVVAAGNPSIGNACGNVGDHAPKSAQNSQEAPKRHTTPVAEPQYSAAPTTGPENQAATEPDGSWETAYEEYTEPDAHGAATGYDEYPQYPQYPQHWDDGGYGNHDDSPSGYGDSPSGHDGAQSGYGDSPSGYGDHPNTDEDTEGGYGDTPPTKPPHKPPTDKPPTDKPPTDKPPTDKPPTDKPPTNQPPTNQPPTDKPPTDQPPTDRPPTDRPPTLPETGSDREALIAAGAASFALIAGGGILYRRGRAASGR